MNRRNLLKGALTAAGTLYLSNLYGKNPVQQASTFFGATQRFKPNWDSLAQYQTPDWYRNAKFGIWAHWGPQCQPQYGDWYGQLMYIESNDKYKYHCKKYGHPSKFGFKDVINEWKADKWDPEALVSLYKKAGAKYFVALANHHDNFDLYPTKYQKWNSANLGPKKDLIKGWADAAKANGLHFGVSVHAAHAWTWYEKAQLADKKGPFAGVPYDGKLTKADGKGQWWEGYDPQELYEQNHALSKAGQDRNRQWEWLDGANIPSKAYCEKFYKRTKVLIDNYEPDFVYYDDTALPLWPISNVGLELAAHLYNESIKKHGKLNAVITGKILTEQQRKCMVWDIERGQSDKIEPMPWQADTCLGNWHYDQKIYDKGTYKTAKTIIHTLVDVVSKNGNLLLSVPVRGDGTIDDKEQVIVEEIAVWMQTNGEAIHDTRPWTKFGEGPAMEASAPLTAQGFNEGKGKPFTANDIRFTTKNKVLYAILLGWPENEKISIKSLAGKGKIDDVILLGNNEKPKFEQNVSGLHVTFPSQGAAKNAFVLKIQGVIS